MLKDAANRRDRSDERRKKRITDKVGICGGAKKPKAEEELIETGTLDVNFERDGPMTWSIGTVI